MNGDEVLILLKGQGFVTSTTLSKQKHTLIVEFRKGANIFLPGNCLPLTLS